MIQVAEELSRTAALLGEEAINKLCKVKVAVFGLGGAGGYAAETLARSGAGAIDLIDGGKVSLSDINRQTAALHSTVGMLKTEALGARLSDISPEIILRKYPLFLNENSAGAFDFSEYDYIIDAMDDTAAKVLLAEICERLGVKLISSMGAEGRFSPMSFKVCDIFSTSVSPAVRVFRHELRNRGIEKLKVVFSTELSKTSGEISASCAFAPAAAGIIIAAEVVKDLLSEEPKQQES